MFKWFHSDLDKTCIDFLIYFIQYCFRILIICFNEITKICMVCMYECLVFPKGKMVASHKLLFHLPVPVATGHCLISCSEQDKIRQPVTMVPSFDCYCSGPYLVLSEAQSSYHVNGP